jgi:cytochrome oxidase Cu insertion factor (SCO1/SenC/PrrC family)
MMRWFATALIVALLVLNWMLPTTSIGRRGNDATVLEDVAGVAALVGQALPELPLFDLDGEPFPLANLRGHKVLLTFERSCDW